jgi:uroporphyrin-3 C-methyltransferase
METPAQTDSTPVGGWRAALRAADLACRPGVALAVVVAQWVDTRMQVSSLQQELARRLADGDSMAKEGRTLARQSQETLAALQAKVGVLEAKLAETQSQAVALEAMYQELSSTRDERLLAEVEQAVVIAMQQLQFAGNVEAALIALQGAEARLARSAQPQFLPVTQADRARHRAPQGHSRGQHQWLSLKIESVVAAVDGLPLAYRAATQGGTVIRPARTPSRRVSTTGASWAPTCGASSASWCASSASTRAIRRCWRRSQSYFLRENLKLRLLNARLALLQRDGKVFREEIRQSREQLDRYFDNRAKPVQAAQSTLSTLAATDVSFDLPGWRKR